MGATTAAKTVQQRVERDLDQLRRRAIEIVPEADLRAKLMRYYETGLPLRVKLGVDPSSPDLHLGHAVVLHKLREFQALGHRVVLVVGDFTARIGDPSGRSAARKLLTKEQVAENMKHYQEQAFRVLDAERIEIRHNSEWLEPLSFAGLLELASKYTVARLLERDDFAARMKNSQPISVLEFLYPLAQAYDSVVLQADVELGGSDQRFNLLATREIQERYGQSPQAVVVMPLLEGTDGKQKMSKSSPQHAIGLDDPPGEMFGKLMSIPDELVEKYVKLCTDMAWDEVKALHPKTGKERLAWQIVSMYHSREAADRAREEFDRVFARGERPSRPQRVQISRGRLKPDGSIWIVDLLQEVGLVKSRSEARRLIEQGGVDLDGQRIASPNTDVAVREGMLLRVGKKAFVEIHTSEATP